MNESKSTNVTLDAIEEMQNRIMALLDKKQKVKDYQKNIIGVEGVGEADGND